MRKVLLALIAVVALATAPAVAHGPSGSREEQGSPSTWDNNVSCGQGTRTPAAVLYAGTNGAEFCNDGSTTPVQGRVIVTTDQGGYVAADGDRDNSEPRLRGWVRIDSKGVRCGDDNGRLDATHPTSEDTSADCG